MGASSGHKITIGLMQPSSGGVSLINVRAIMAVLGVGLMAVVIAGCAQAPQPRAATVRPASPDASGPADTSSAGSADPMTRTRSTPRSVVVASKDVAYVVAGTGAGRAGHPVLYSTRDGGASFHRVSAPAVRVRGRWQPLSRLVFVNARDGYAVFGDWTRGHATALVYTSDGARSWHRSRLPGRHSGVAALAGHGGRVYAATIACESAVRCPTVHVYSARAGTGNWRRGTGAIPRRNSAGGVGLAGWGPAVWLAVGVGESHDPVLLRSEDAATSFTRTGGSVDDVVCSLAATSRQVIWSSCATGMLMAFARTEQPGPARSLPVVGSGTGDTFLDALSDRVAYFGTAVGRRAGLYLTHNGGHTFHRVAAFPRGASRSGYAPDFAFLSEQTALCAVPGSSLLRTSNGGRTWHAVRLPTTDPDESQVLDAHRLTVVLRREGTGLRT